jgi:tetratricopeptide (TPR) repeat protein
MADAKQHYLDGLKLFGAKQHEAAIAEYDRALAERPDWVDVLLAKATCQSNLGQHDQAIETVRRVIELTPEDAMAYTSLSIFLQRQNKIPEAEAAQAKARMISWKEELKTNPKAPPPEDPKGIRVVQ